MKRKTESMVSYLRRSTTTVDILHWPNYPRVILPINSDFRPFDWYSVYNKDQGDLRRWGFGWTSENREKVFVTSVTQLGVDNMYLSCLYG